ncbi:MAG: glutaredoxin family protein [Acidobacteria bacterium]|nr:glutaredoxin family protein [Acidobacteriota bacterium]
MKEFLSRAGATFIVRNIDEDPGAFDDLARLGVMSIPFTLIGDYAIRGFDEKKLKEALAAHCAERPGR